MSDIFEIRKSQVSGLGLFAKKLIKKREQILKFTGEIISSHGTEKYIPDMGNPLQIGSNEYIDLEEPGVLVNHSCFPNAGIRNDCYLIAIQDIQPGQEIFYDYSTTMDEDDWTLECKCGETNCRNIIKDFRYLPPDIQENYLSLDIVQSYIKEKYYSF